MSDFQITPGNLYNYNLQKTGQAQLPGDANQAALPGLAPPRDNQLAAGFLGALKGGTFGISDLIANAVNKAAYKKLQEENPEAFKGGELAGDIGSMFIPVAGWVGKGLKGAQALTNLGRGAEASKGLLGGLGTALENVGTKGTIGSMAAGGAANAALGTGIRDVAGNIANPEDQKDVLGDVALSGLTGGIGGGALGTVANIGRAVSGAAKGLDSVVLSKLGLTPNDVNTSLLAGRPGVSALGRIARSDEPQGLINFVKENDLGSKTPQEIADYLYTTGKAKYAPIDQMVQAHPQEVATGWKAASQAASDQAVSKWAEKFMPDGKSTAGEVLKDVTNKDPGFFKLGDKEIEDLGGGLLGRPGIASSINKQVETSLANGNLADTRQLINDNLNNALKAAAKDPSNPLNGAQADLWKAHLDALDNTVNNLVERYAPGSPNLADAGQFWKYSQILGTGAARNIAAQSVTNPGGYTTLAALSIFNGQPASLIAALAAGVGGKMLKKGVESAAQGMTGPVSALNIFGNAPRKVLGDSSIFDFLSNNLKSPQAISAAGQGASGLLRGGLPQTDITPSASGAPTGQAFMPSGPTPPVGPGGPGGPGGPISGPQFTTPSGQQQNPTGVHPALYLAHAAVNAQNGKEGQAGQQQLNEALMTGLTNRWNADPYMPIVNGRASMDNPKFLEFVRGAVYNLTNGDPRNPLDPTRMGQYLFLDPKDQEMYQRGIESLQKIQGNYKEAAPATGLLGPITEFFNPKAKISKLALKSAMEDLAASQGRTDMKSIDDAVDTVLNAPFLSNEERKNQMVGLINRFAPKAYAQLVRAGQAPQ